MRDLLRNQMIIDDEGSIVNTRSRRTLNGSLVSIDYSSYQPIRSLRIHRLIFRPLAVALFVLYFHGNLRRSAHLSKRNLHNPYWAQPIKAKANNDNSPTDSDPQLQGWEPKQYPDPKSEPNRCGIAYLVNTNPLFLFDENEASLRLCDPDWVLGGVYLEQIATSMADFRKRFSSFHYEGDGDFDQADFGQSFSEEDFGVEYDEDKDDEGIEELSNDTKAIVYDAPSSDLASHFISFEENMVELAVATVRKMNIPLVLEQGSYYSYEDEDDMVNDAAQIFASSLHHQWWQGWGENGILIFLSIQDRVCFISTGSAISTILPWWRLERIVSSMKPDLHHRDYAHALLTAIDEISAMLRGGPPSMADRLHDFMARFGIVIAFAMFTFIFGAWGEFRERRKRWQYAESRSKLTPVEREKARLLQREFKSQSCPICLEKFDYGEDLFLGDETRQLPEMTVLENEDKPSSLKRVDSFGIPLCGGDRKTIKLLRCGHIFCESCWKGWIHSGYGNPCICPVCRQDIGKSSKNRRRRRNETQSSEDYDRTPLISNTPRREIHGSRYTTSYDAMGIMSSRVQSTNQEETETEDAMYRVLRTSLSEPRDSSNTWDSSNGYLRLTQPMRSSLRQDDQRNDDDPREESRSLLSNNAQRSNWFSR